MRRVFAVALGKLLRFLLRLVRRGGGSALPGLVSARIYPGLLTGALQSLPMGVVVVSGSAGKSSTTFQLVELLRRHGLRVFTNPSTANIRQGLFAAVLKESNLRGRISYDIAVLELDEGHGAALAEELGIELAVLTNVLSDQLDRFVDPELVAEKLSQIAQKSKQLIVNSDDKNLTQFAAEHRDVVGFGLVEKCLSEPDAPQYALNFGPHPVIEKQVSVQDDKSVTFKSVNYPTTVASWELALNFAAALLAASKFAVLDPVIVRQQFASGAGVFARNENTVISGRAVNLRLVQNPTSFQLNLDELSANESPLMLMAGRDIHDPSWLWTVDFSRLKRVDIVAGYNAYELALRLKVAGVEVVEVIPGISESADRFFSLPGDTPTILFSADAMRRFRRYTKVAK